MPPHYHPTPILWEALTKWPLLDSNPGPHEWEKSLNSITYIASSLWPLNASISKSKQTNERRRPSIAYWLTAVHASNNARSWRVDIPYMTVPSVVFWNEEAGGCVIRDLFVVGTREEIFELHWISLNMYFHKRGEGSSVFLLQNKGHISNDFLHLEDFWEARLSTYM